MQNESGTQVRYVTLAQSRQAAGCFTPVVVDHRGIRSLPVAHRGRSTIASMAAICKAYGWRHNLPVLFKKHLASLPIPEPVRSELEALVLAEVEEVLK